MIASVPELMTKPRITISFRLNDRCIIWHCRTARFSLGDWGPSEFTGVGITPKAAWDDLMLRLQVSIGHWSFV